MYNIYLPWPCMCVHTHAGNRTQVLSFPPYLLHRNMERQAPCFVTRNSARHLVLNRLNFSTSAYLIVSVVCVEFGFQSVCRTKGRQEVFWEASGCWHSRTWVHFPDPGSGAPQQQDHSGSPRAAAQKELL